MHLLFAVVLASSWQQPCGVVHCYSCSMDEALNSVRQKLAHGYKNPLRIWEWGCDSSCPRPALYLTTVHHNKEIEKDGRDKVEPHHMSSCTYSTRILQNSPTEMNKSWLESSGLQRGQEKLLLAHTGSKQTATLREFCLNFSADCVRMKPRRLQMPMVLKAPKQILKGGGFCCCSAGPSSILLWGKTHFQPEGS